MPTRLTTKNALLLKLTVPLALAPFSGLNVAKEKVSEDEKSVSAHPASVSGGNEFNSAMLSGSGEKIDVSRFSHGNIALPGRYRPDVYVNQDWLGRRDIDVNMVNGSDQTAPCITKTLLIQMGVDFSTLPDTESKDDGCINMSVRIPESSVEFDFSEQRLNISIPQLYLKHISRGYVDPEEWDNGINAAFVNYNLNSTRISGQENASASNQLFLGLNSGLNLESWRIRYNGTYTTDPGTSMLSSTTGEMIEGVTGQPQKSSRWQPINAYAQHDIASLKSQLTIGETYTGDDLFNSVAFKGVQLASDDRMLPESQRGYAPVIRGVAETNAKIIVRQGGNIIYETTVPPGEFKIDDMYNSSFAGDFVVTIAEIDGRQKQYVVPYSAGVLSLRSGASRYSASVGKLSNVTSSNGPVFSQGTFQHGFGQGVTLYGGAIAGKYYGSVLAGAALSTRFGAFGLDLTHSVMKPVSDDRALSGRSWRLSYSKLLTETRTNFSVAAYSYLTKDFLTLTNAAMLHDDPSAAILAPKNSFQLMLSQPIGDKWGSLYLGGVAQYYWNNPTNSINYQAGYSTSMSWGNFGLTLSRTLDAWGAYHNLTSVNVTLPIGKSTSIRRPTLMSTVNYGDQQTSTRVMVNGTLGEGNRFNYNAYDNYANTTSGSDNRFNLRTNTVGVGAQYSGSQGQVGASYSTSSGSTRQTSFNASGAVILHYGGMLLAPSLGETVGLVYAPGAEGATVMTANNNKIDSGGYAVIPYLNPYMNNDVVIDPRGSSVDMELDSTSRQVVPTAGAIVILKFSTTIGRAILTTVRREDGKSLPMGSSVLDEQGKEIDMLSQRGQFFNRSLSESGIFTVKWGEGPNQRCVANYTLPPKDKSGSGLPYEHIAVICRIENDQE